MLQSWDRPGENMKYLFIGLAIITLILTSCSSHYQKTSGESVMLYLKEPHAKTITLHCSLNSFKGQALNNKKGTWMVSLPANRSFRYFYKVDGKVFTPPCSKTEKDDFGSTNCIFEPEL